MSRSKNALRFKITLRCLRKKWNTRIQNNQQLSLKSKGKCNKAFNITCSRQFLNESKSKEEMLNIIYKYAKEKHDAGYHYLSRRLDLDAETVTTRAKTKAKVISYTEMPPPLVRKYSGDNQEQMYGEYTRGSFVKILKVLQNISTYMK